MEWGLDMWPFKEKSIEVTVSSKKVDFDLHDFCDDLPGVTPKGVGCECDICMGGWEDTEVVFHNADDEDCPCDICSDNKKKLAEAKSREEIENRDYGLGFKPWKRVEEILPKPPEGHYWLMELAQYDSGAKYFDFDGAHLIKWANGQKAKDTFIVLRLMKDKKTVFTRHINLTGQSNRMYYTKFYKNRLMFESPAVAIVHDTKTWADAMVDSVQIAITPISKRIG